MLKLFMNYESSSHFTRKPLPPENPDNILVLQSLANELDIQLIWHTLDLLFTHKCPLAV